MARLGDIATKVRSKNAGPFTLTIDVFFADADSYARVCKSLSNYRVAALYRAAPETIKRFELDRLNVLKFSLPRPVIQGAIEDRDMHASQWGWLLAEMELNP